MPTSVPDPRVPNSTNEAATPSSPAQHASKANTGSNQNSTKSGDEASGNEATNHPGGKPNKKRNTQAPPKKARPSKKLKKNEAPTLGLTYGSAFPSQKKQNGPTPAPTTKSTEAKKLAKPLNENAEWLIRRLIRAPDTTRGPTTTISDFAEMIIKAMRELSEGRIFEDDYETHLQSKLFEVMNDGYKRDHALMFDIIEMAEELRDDKDVTICEIRRAAAYLSTGQSLNATPAVSGVDSVMPVLMGVGNPYKQYNSLKKKQSSCPTRDQIVPLFDQYLAQHANKDGCTGTRKKQLKACKCLHILKNDLCRVAVAKACAQHASKTFEEKREWLIVNCRYANHSPTNNICFHLPFDHNGNSSVAKLLNETKVCVDSFQTVMGIKYKGWKNIKQLVYGNKESVAHGLKGRTGKDANAKTEKQIKMDEDLDKYFSEELFPECDVQATRFVRSETGQVIERDNNDNYRYLPSNMSKIYCYQRFCFHRGWYVYFDGAGKVIQEERPQIVDPAKTYLLPFDNERKNIPAWSTFYGFWERSYPHLKVNTSAEDICGECYRFYNRHRYAGKVSSFYHSTDGKRSEGEGTKSGMINHQSELFVCKEINSDGDDEIDEEIDDTVITFKASEANADPVEEQNERVTLTMARHTIAARKQRGLASEKMEAAKAHAADPTNKPKVKTLVADYCQHLAYPWYGANQPGETYYFPHVNAYLFGIVDVADTTINKDCTPESRLHAHVYTEGEGNGGKGGNNVASLLMKQLRIFGWLETLKDGEESELNIIMDNCGGQNKNNMVLRLAPYLVEQKFFTKVNFIFLIAGHTKNIADRMFNTLKSVFRKSQVWGMSMMYEKLASRTCTVHPYEVGDFKKYDEHLNKFYVTYHAVKKYHIFSCSTDDITNNISCSTDEITTGQEVIVHFKEFDADDAITKRQNVIHKTNLDNRLQKMKDTPLGIIPEGGLNPYKVVQLFREHRPLLPEYWQDITCPEPTPSEWQKVTKEKEIREKNKVELKKMKKEKTKVRTAEKMIAEGMVETKGKPGTEEELV